MAKRPGKHTKWTSKRKDTLAEISPKDIDLVALRWQIRQPVVTQGDADKMPGLIVTGRRLGRNTIYDPPRPDGLTNIISVVEVSE